MKVDCQSAVSYTDSGPAAESSKLSLLFIHFSMTFHKLKFMFMKLVFQFTVCCLHVTLASPICSHGNNTSTR